MKKAIFILGGIIATSFTLISCNKDYECVCRVNGTETNRYSVRDSNKNGAEDQCNQKQSSLGVTYSCKIE
jgi:hypothetical protein